MRPKTLAEIVGQKTLVKTLVNQFHNRLPHFFILYGEVGSGKTTLARMISLAIQLGKNVSEIVEDDWSKYRTFEIKEVNAANNNGIDFVRGIIDSMKYKPINSKAKIVIFDEAHQLTQSSQNALLTETEDVSEHVFYIFCTSELGCFVDGLSRRGTWFCTQPLKDGEIAALVGKAGKSVNDRDDVKLDDLVSALQKNQVRSSGIVLQACERFFSGMTASVSVNLSTTTSNDSKINVGVLCRYMLDGKWDKIKPALKTVKRGEVTSLKIRLLSALQNELFSGDANTSFYVAEAMRIVEKSSEGGPYSCYGFSSAVCRACRSLAKAKSSK